MILKDKIVLMNIMQIIVHIYQLMMDQLEIIFVLKKKNVYHHILFTFTLFS